MPKKRLIPIDSPSLLAAVGRAAEQRRAEADAKTRLKVERKIERATRKIAGDGRRRASQTPVPCPLCGIPVQPGEMLDHKHLVHGESKITPSPALPHNENQWVSVAQGGLPSLGKRSR
jgi:hypothetical protein